MDEVKGQIALSYSTQPPGARLRFETHETGVRFVDVPRSLLGRERGGVIAFGIVLAAMGWRAVLMAVDGWTVPVFILGGVTIATAFLVVDRVRRGRMPIVLGTDGDELFLVRPGVLGPGRTTWERGQVADIEAVSRGVGLHMKRLGLLRIRFHSDGRTDLFDGLDLAELAWVERTLRQALRMPETRRSMLQKVATAVGL